MNIALAQMEVVPGQPKKNLETMLRMIIQAKQRGAHLIAFPEMCVGGYLLGDRFLRDTFCRDLMEYNEDLRKASDGIAIAYGNIFLDEHINQRVGDNKHHPNKDGRTRKYNAVYIFQDGKPVRRLRETNLLPLGVQPKTLLPNYRFFDDERYFFSLEDVAKDFGVSLESLLFPFLIRVDGQDVPVGFEICEDLWCEDYRRNGEAQNVTKILIKNGAQQIVNISASPWTFGKNDARDRRIQFLKQEAGEDFRSFFYVNCTGTQNNGKNIITFDGGSTIYNADGKPIALCKEPYKEELLVMDTETIPRRPVVEREEKPMIAQKLDAIITGLQHLKDIRGAQEQPRYVIGMSGGVDSAVVAAILTLAVGPDKVLGINMPTRFNAAATKQSAKYTAEQLGIAYHEVPIEELALLNERILDTYDFDGKSRTLNAVQRGNVAAKIRGTNLLSNLAAKYGALFTNNGNKLEVALGYATLYGDVNGAVCPIADLLKIEIFELAKYLNEQVFGREVISTSVIPDDLCHFGDAQILPSAELEEKQIDPMKFFYHDALLAMAMDYQRKTIEDFAQWFIDGTLHQKVAAALVGLGKTPEWGQRIMERWNVTNPQNFIDDLEWFFPLAEQSVFKRVQTGPIIDVSKSAFGYDERESQLPWQPTRVYDRLKQEVLALSRYTPQDS